MQRTRPSYRNVLAVCSHVCNMKRARSLALSAMDLMRSDAVHLDTPPSTGICLKTVVPVESRVKSVRSYPVQAENFADGGCRGDVVCRSLC